MSESKDHAFLMSKQVNLDQQELSAEELEHAVGGTSTHHPPAANHLLQHCATGDHIKEAKLSF